LFDQSVSYLLSGQLLREGVIARTHGLDDLLFPSVWRPTIVVMISSRQRCLTSLVALTSSRDDQTMTRAVCAGWDSSRFDRDIENITGLPTRSTCLAGRDAARPPRFAMPTLVSTLAISWCSPRDLSRGTGNILFTPARPGSGLPMLASMPVADIDADHDGRLLKS